MGEPISIDLSIAPPEPGRLSFAKKDIAAGSARGAFQVFWKAPGPENTESYLAYQILIQDEQQGFVAECSGFNAVEGGPYFPVGSCSGPLGAVETATRMGITFRKVPRTPQPTTMPQFGRL